MSNEPQESADRSSITSAHTSLMLRYTLKERSGVIDRVIQRLERDDGPAWFASTLEALPLCMFGVAEDALVRGAATLDELHSLKTESKLLHRKGNREEKQEWVLAGLLGYFLAVAAALVHHDAVISSRSLDELNPILLDLASVLPDPWTDFLARAATAPRD